MMSVRVPGLSLRPTLAAYCHLYGYDRATFVRPKCRRWWLELRRIRLRTRLSIFDGFHVSTVMADTKIQPISAADIIRMYHRIQEKHGKVTVEVRSHPHALREMCATLPMFPQDPKQKLPNTIYGLPLIEDPTLGQNEMRIVYGKPLPRWEQPENPYGDGEREMMLDTMALVRPV